MYGGKQVAVRQTGVRCGLSEGVVEAEVGIEPAYTALQAAA